jgi:hypothetical protein
MQSATRNKLNCYNKDVSNFIKLINLNRSGISFSIRALKTNISVIFYFSRPKLSKLVSEL